MDLQNILLDMFKLNANSGTPEEFLMRDPTNCDQMFQDPLLCCKFQHFFIHSAIIYI